MTISEEPRGLANTGIDKSAREVLTGKGRRVGTDCLTPNRTLLVVPVHNEGARLEYCARKLVEFCSEKHLDLDMIFAEDGSSDSSRQVLSALQHERPSVKLLLNGERLGRGRAVRNAWRSTDAEVYAYMDADLATDLESLPILINEVKAGCDLALGSRYLNGSSVERPPLRAAVSLTYNNLVRFIFGSRITDYQCGFKALSPDFAKFVCEHSHESHWAWDTEIALLAEKHGFNVKEIPVHWKEPRSSRTPLTRLAKDIVAHLGGITRIAVRMKRGSE